MDDTVLLLPKFTVDEITQHTRFLILSLPNNEMSRKSPFIIHKALLGIGGEPKSIKKLRSGDLLIETISAVQSKSFLLAKTFIDSPLIVTPHRTLNSCRGVISESDLLYASETEILEGLSDQGVTQVRRIKIKKETSLFPTKHLILTFNSFKLPSNIKAGYLNCKLRPYIPNPLRCFKCQRFGHSQNSCRGQLTCSRCAAVGHSSTDCTLEPKCINCSQPHTADSKLCPKWKTEKQIQEIKTNRNITYVEARKLIVPQTSHTYAQAAKSSNKTSSTQTDENITKIKCPPLELLQPLSSTTRTNISISTPDVSTSSSSTQAQLLPSTSSISTSNSESQPPIPTCTDAPSNNMVTPIESSSSIIPTSSSQSVIQPPSDSNTVQDAKKLAKARSRKRKKELLKKMKEAIIDIKINPHRPKKPASDESTTDEEEMIVYDVEDEIESNPDYVKQNVAAIDKSSTSTQAELVPSTSTVTVTSPSKSQRTNSLIDLYRIFLIHKIKTAPHRPRESAPTEYSTDEKDIIYDVEDEPELNPKYVLTYMGELVKGHNCASIRYDFENPIEKPC
ncbi:uncharacterized protein TNCV_4816391 [Trichonephila clavipes]|nr:uncharacterized protein TNCV_4816391 [Trichonephila clavipes]